MKVSRKAFVSGQFYPSGKKELISFLSENIPVNNQKKECLACIMPHAGYMYSGKIAAEVVAEINIPELVIILGPNHTGLGQPCSLMSQGDWETPLGTVPIDSALAGMLLDSDPCLENDPLAHLQEHSIEVELPFLQYLNPGFSFVPICLQYSDPVRLSRLGSNIAAALKKYGRQTLIVASSDMTHYESKQDARRKDMKAIEAMKSLDEQLLDRTVKADNITMCGIAPAIVMLSAARAMGASKGELVRYTTSGDVTGEDDRVVGYAGMIFS